jgi:AcrR family transcriptional regulator
MTRRSPVQSNHVLPSRQSAESPVTSPGEEPAWKQRAVERSIKTAKLRAAQRVQRFLDAAQAIIIEKGSTDFTVQEVVDRSRQSLRSFYLQFDGKHELLLALFEDALSRSADQIRAATANHSDPIDRLRVAVELLFEASRPDPTAKRPLFTDFAPRLLVSHPAEVKVAHAPLLALLTELMEAAGDAGELRTGINPRRMAAMTMQTVMFIAQSSGSSDDATVHPISADEVWDFCSRGFVGNSAEN